MYIHIYICIYIYIYIYIYICFFVEAARTRSREGFAAGEIPASVKRNILDIQELKHTSKS